MLTVRAVSVVTHKLIELNKTCMDATLKPLSTVMNENGSNKAITVIKPQKCERTVKTLTSHYIKIFM